MENMGILFNPFSEEVPKYQNSMYFEELTGLLQRVALEIDGNNNYYFSDEYYLDDDNNMSFNKFINEFKNSFFNTTSDKVTIIQGTAGIGKTLFLNKGIQKLLRSPKNINDRFVGLGVDFQNIDPKKDVSFYVKYIYEKLHNNAIDAIRKIDKLDVYTKEKAIFVGNEENTTDAKLFPVKFFCEQIYKKYENPCIIILDNIDLACSLTQKNVFKATSIVALHLANFMEYSGLKETYRIYFAMRPETSFHRSEMRIGQIIDFPHPNILAITLAILKKEIKELAKKLDKEGKLKCEVTYHNIVTGKQQTASSFSDVAEYFIKIFTHFLKDIWDDDVVNRLGTNEYFHCSIVNYNLRKFLSFLSDTLSNGGFKPLTKDFNEKAITPHYGIYDYIDMLVRGRWHFHPGNKTMDSEGGNKAPIVFNIFDTCRYGGYTRAKIDNFMIYIRILQYIKIFSVVPAIRYGVMKDALCDFYNEKEIEDAVKQLIFVNLLHSSTEGVDSIASKYYHFDIDITYETTLELTQTGDFYIEKFIYEFEYLYNMAITSIMLNNSVTELQNNWKSEKEIVVYHFLKGVFCIICDNINRLSNEKLKKFKDIFCSQDLQICFPYYKMLTSFMDVMNTKINYANKKELFSLAEKYENTLSLTIDLKNDLEKFKESKLDD